MLTTKENIEQQMLIINGTSHTPKIEFNGVMGTYTISGRANGLHPGDFWKPLLLLGREFTERQRKSSLFEFHFEHINSTSITYVLQFIRTLIRSGDDLKIHWYVNREDGLLEIVEMINEIADKRIITKLI